MHNAATTFTGTLVRRQYKRGQPFVQLVFRNGRHTRLSLSRNARLIQSLQVGQTYHISGTEYQLGGKTFIREPEAQLAASTGRRLHKRLMLAGALALLFVLAGGVFAVGHFSGKKAVQASSSSVRPAVKVAASVLSADTTAQAAPANTVATAAVPPPAPVKTTAKTVTHSSPPASSAPQTQTQASAPAAPQTPAPTQPDTTPPASDPTPATPPADTPPADTTTPPADTTPPPTDTPPDTTTPPADTPPPAQ